MAKKGEKVLVLVGVSVNVVANGFHITTWDDAGDSGPEYVSNTMLDMMAKVRELLTPAHDRK